MNVLLTYSLNILQRVRPADNGSRQFYARGGYVPAERSRTYSTPQAGQQRTTAR